MICEEDKCIPVTTAIFTDLLHLYLARYISILNYLELVVAQVGDMLYFYSIRKT